MSTSTGVRKRRTPEDRINEAIDGVGDAYLRKARRYSDKAFSQGGALGTGAIYGSTNPGTNSLQTSGGTMIGSIAFNPLPLGVIEGRINIEPGQSGTSKASSYVLAAGTGSPDELRFIDGADKNGQYIILQATETQILILRAATLPPITSISGLGTVTVDTQFDHNLTSGDRVNILGTQNFDINNVEVTVTTSTQFTYSATGNILSGDGGLVQDGNIVTPDGNDVILNATISPNGIPVASLIFDPFVEGFGAWRLVSVSVSTGGAFSFPILYPQDDFGDQGAVNLNVDISGNTGQNKKIRMVGDVGFQFTSPPGSTVLEEIWVTFEQDGTGNHSITTTPTGLKNAGLLNGLLGKTANEITTFHFITEDGGVTFRGELVDLTVAAAGNVPDGTDQFEHLEWNGTAWIAQQKLNFGPIPGTQGQLNFPNNITGLAWKNQAGGATGDLTLTVNASDTFLFGIGDGNDVLEISAASIDVKTLDVINIDRAIFDASSTLTTGNTNSVIIFNTANQFQFNTDKANDFVFSLSNNAAFIIDENSNDRNFVVQSDSTNQNSTPFFNIIKNFNNPELGSVLGQIVFKGGESTSAGIVGYAEIQSIIRDKVIATLEGSLILSATRAGSEGIPFIKINDNTDHNIEFEADLDLNTFDIRSIDRLRFESSSGGAATTSDPSIFLDGVSNMVFNLADQKQFFWSMNSKPRMALDQSETNNDTILTVETDDGDASAIPFVNIFRDDPSPAKDTEITNLQFIGTHADMDGGAAVGAASVYSKIVTEYESVITGREAASLNFFTSFDTGTTTQLKSFLGLNNENSNEIEAFVDVNLNEHDITNVADIKGIDDGTTQFQIIFDAGGNSDTSITNQSDQTDRINVFANNINGTFFLFNTNNSEYQMGIPDGVDAYWSLGDHRLEFDATGVPTDAVVGNDSGVVFLDTTTDPPILKIKKKTTAGATSLISLEGVGVEGANRTLSNLSSPTAVSVSLIPQGDGNLVLGDTNSHWDDVFSETFTLKGSGGNPSQTIFSITADDSSLNGMNLQVPTSREIQFHIGTTEVAHFGGTSLIMEHHAISAVNAILMQNPTPSNSVGIFTIGTSTVGLEFRNATAGTYDFQLSSTSILKIFADNLTIGDGINIVLGAGTGSKIASSITQKLGFWGATPVVQQTVAPDTLANLYAALRLIGIIG